jgi:hypothetical protein
MLCEMSLDEAAALFDLETKSMTGRPLDSAAFVADVEKRLGYSVAPQKRGPKGKQAGGGFLQLVSRPRNLELEL